MLFNFFFQKFSIDFRLRKRKIRCWCFLYFTLTKTQNGCWSVGIEHTEKTYNSYAAHARFTIKTWLALLLWVHQNYYNGKQIRNKTHRYCDTNTNIHISLIHTHTPKKRHSNNHYRNYKASEILLYHYIEENNKISFRLSH